MVTNRGRPSVVGGRPSVVGRRSSVVYPLLTINYKPTLSVYNRLSAIVRYYRFLPPLAPIISFCQENAIGP